jgi:hypothetical protein
MSLDLKAIRTVFSRQLASWVEAMPAEKRNRTLFESADGTERLTALDILHHVEEETPLGDELLENAIGLAAAGQLANSLSDGDPFANTPASNDPFSFENSAESKKESAD